MRTINILILVFLGLVSCKKQNEYKELNQYLDNISKVGFQGNILVSKNPKIIVNKLFGYSDSISNKSIHYDFVWNKDRLYETISEEEYDFPVTYDIAINNNNEIVVYDLVMSNLISLSLKKDYLIFNNNQSEMKFIKNKQPRGRAVEVLNRNSFFISTQSVGELNPKND